MDWRQFDNLWPHQRKAVSALSKYMSESTDKAFLVHMPTGSGKTGIIATVARCVQTSKVKGILVLAPRVALRDQLHFNLESHFFKNVIDLEDEAFSAIEEKTKVLLLASTNISLDTEKDRIVIVSTIQKVNTLHSSSKDSDRNYFERLSNLIDLVIIDEGHYEPAYSWSNTIRHLGDKRILFTATPYRNDFKRFDFDKDWVYSYSYNLALKDHFLREVKFLDSDLERREGERFKVSTFCDDVIAQYNRLKSDDTNLKVIIRCDDSESILQLGTYLVSKYGEENVICLHENFKDNDNSWTAKRVPIPRAESENVQPQIFWVHQYKLIEGIDNKHFGLLALYDRMNNERSLVQQIGRILRNPDKEPGKIAYVIDHYDGDLSHIWTKFKAFDSMLRGGKEDGIFLLGSPTERLNKAISENFEKYEYLFNGFKTRYDDNTFDFEDFKIPFRINLFQKINGFRFEKFRKELEKEFDSKDYQYVSKAWGDRSIVYYYRSVRNSDYFYEKYSFVLKDGVCIIVDFNEELLGFYDSSSFSPLSQPERFYVNRSFDRDSLVKVYNKESNSFVSKVTLKNTNISINAIKTHTYSAASVENSPPFLDDSSQVLNTVTGYYVSGTRILSNGDERDIRSKRYLGFKTGRISERDDFGSIKEYFDWLNGIEDLIYSSSEPIDTFERFAKVRGKPPTTTPDYISFYSDYIPGLFKISAGNEKDLDEDEPIYIDPSPVQVVQEDDGSFFEFVVNDTLFKMSVSFSGDKYLFNSEDLVTNFEPQSHNTEYTSIPDYFNKTQTDFSIVLENGRTVYIDREFLIPSVKFGADFAEDTFREGKIIHSFTYLVESEKGKAFDDQSGWSSDSLFGFFDDYVINAEIDHPMHDFLKDFDTVVCDDGSNEICDFLLASSTLKKVVMVHAKHGHSSYGTGGLQDVCRQAMANVRWINMFLQHDPMQLDSWGEPYYLAAVGTVKHRVRKPLGADGFATWKKIKKMIQDPLTTREVWLLVGNILNKEELIAQLRKEVPNPFALNTVKYLQGTMQSIGSNMVSLKVMAVNNP